MWKPLFEEEGFKPTSKKFAPKPTPPEVKESRLKVVTEGRDSAGNLIVTQLRVTRKSLCGARDKLACAGSSVHTRKFVVANAHVDRRMDAPAPLPVGVHTPKKVMGRRMPKPCRRVD